MLFLSEVDLSPLVHEDDPPPRPGGPGVLFGEDTFVKYSFEAYSAQYHLTGTRRFEELHLAQMFPSVQVKPSLRIKKADISRLSETFGPATLILLCKNIVYVAVTVSTPHTTWQPKETAGCKIDVQSFRIGLSGFEAALSGYDDLLSSQMSLCKSQQTIHGSKYECKCGHSKCSVQRSVKAVKIYKKIICSHLLNPALALMPCPGLTPPPPPHPPVSTTRII